MQPQLTLTDSTLYDELTHTNGYKLHFVPWFYNHRTNWPIKTYNQLSDTTKMVFVTLVHCFFCCLGCGVEDHSAGYQMYDASMTVSLVLTLLLKISNKIYNNPSSTNDCWLATRMANDDDYLYVTASISAPPGQKKTFRVKAIRLVCALFNRPTITKSDILQASHLCHKHTNCVNPWHLHPETDADNKNRQQCTNGCANYCPHAPKCKWTDINGRLLLHRNDINRAYSRLDCNCGNGSCFEN